MDWGGCVYGLGGGGGSGKQPRWGWPLAYRYDGIRGSSPVWVAVRPDNRRLGPSRAGEVRARRPWGIAFGASRDPTQPNPCPIPFHQALRVFPTPNALVRQWTPHVNATPQALGAAHVGEKAMMSKTAKKIK